MVNYWQGGQVRRIKVNDLKPNMIIARSIYSGDSKILLHEGMILTRDSIRRLYELGIHSVYIKEELIEEVGYSRDIITDEIRMGTIKTVKDNFESLENHLKLNMHLIKHIVDEIINELLENDHILIQLTDIRAFDDYLFSHSVNVCVLSILTGITMGYNLDRLKELGLGALLHDIGKTKIDKEILNKPDDLSRQEFDEVKRHTRYGFDILREYEEISLLSAHIAYQHHERWDGQGYPRGLHGKDIHEYARIVAVADVYDALLADRPYRPSYTVNQALTILERMSGIYLEPYCVTALISNIAIYPVGGLVEISTGYIGIVVDVNRNAPTKPVVKIIMDNEGRRLPRTHEVDLSQLSTIMIVKPLSNKDIEQLKIKLNTRK